MRGVIVVGLVVLSGCGGREVTGVAPGPQPFGGTTTVVSSNGGSAGSSGGSAGSSALGVPVEGPAPDAPTAMTDPLTKAVKSAGCGTMTTIPSGVTLTLVTRGEKAQDCADMLDGNPVCGRWSTTRSFTVNLPQGYDVDKAYPLVLEAPGCGGSSKDVWPLNAIGGTVIRVGIAPGPNSTGHGTNENQGCFDDKEGDDSIDWVFYENLYDRLNAELCFDRNRVFTVGNSSGSWFSNELICKYAGDALRPVRGASARSGGLPTDPKFVPTCTTAPMAGFWVHEINDLTTPFSNAKVAIARAMAVNGCTLGNGFDTASFENFPIGGGIPDDTCKRIQGCDPLYPLVVCPLPGNSHGSNDNIMNNGVSTFVKLFSSGSMLTQ